MCIYVDTYNIYICVCVCVIKFDLPKRMLELSKLLQELCKIYCLDLLSSVKQKRTDIFYNLIQSVFSFECGGLHLRGVVTRVSLIEADTLLDFLSRLLLARSFLPSSGLTR